MSFTTKSSPNVNIGITDENRTAISGGLAKVQADTYALYQKTHYFHWNVTGPMFNTLHLMFETQYNEAWMAVDEIAERIRALGHFAPGTSKDYTSLTSIKDAEGIPHAKDMIKQLVQAHESVIRTARGMFETAASAGDEATCDLLNARTSSHEKTAWMLRSMIEE
jgi:starvation-inducible DNA-binding protein